MNQLTSQSKIILSGASLLEVPLVLLGEGFSNNAIQETITTMKQALGSLCKYTILEVAFEDVTKAFELRDKYKCSFFDSLHISIALNNNLMFLSSDSDIIDVLKKEGGKILSLLTLT
jgi:predicted nucleic acid-binding protein